MIKFIYRNLLIYYKDISGVFFSFLGMLISLLIYIFFLKNNLVDSLGKIPNATKIIDTWMIAGLISIVSMTSPLSAFEQKIEDKKELYLYDAIVNSRLSLSKVDTSYIITSIFEGSISTIFFSILCYWYLALQYNFSLSVKEIGLCLLYMLVLIIFSSFLFSIITFFINSVSGFASLSAIVGTLAGFLSGSYIIIGELPKFIQSILKYWPGFDIAGLLRDILMPIDNIPDSILKSLGVLHGYIYLTSSCILIFILILLKQLFTYLKK